MDKNIIIRKIRLSDQYQLADLYDRVWPEERGHHLEKTKWAISSSEHTGVCAVDGDRIIGSRSCFHTNVKYGGETVDCVQFGDSCVDSDYRGQGLFLKMNQAFLADFYRTGDELIYNVSVDASRRAYEKLGWVYLDSLSKLIKIVRPLSFIRKTKGDIRLLSGNPSFDPAEAPDLSVIPEDLLKVRQSLMIEAGLLFNDYDRKTLDWRMGSGSDIRLFHYPGVGSCCYKVGTKNGLRCCIVGEVFLYDYSFRNLKKVLRILMKGADFDLMETVVSHAHPMYRWFRRMGFLVNPAKVYLNFGVKARSDRMKEISLNPENWALCNMDIDTF